jgi:hypothetical protein
MAKNKFSIISERIGLFDALKCFGAIKKEMVTQNVCFCGRKGK